MSMSNESPSPEHESNSAPAPDEGRVKILLTGFGPFRGHPINASWEAVKELRKTWTDEDAAQIDLVVEEVPVVYETVSKRVPELWGTHEPDVAIHVGVSGYARELTLEQQARNEGFNQPDVEQKLPLNCRCVPKDSNPCDLIRSVLDVAKIQDTLNSNPERCSNVEACLSDDPGLYLCEFIYFTSLHHSEGKSLFVHVPPLHKPYSKEQLAAALRVVVQEVAAQILSKDCPDNHVTDS